MIQKMLRNKKIEEIESSALNLTMNQMRYAWCEYQRIMEDRRKKAPWNYIAFPNDKMYRRIHKTKRPFLAQYKIIPSVGEVQLYM